MKGKFVIIDLRNMRCMKDEGGKVIYYDTLDEAKHVCGMYEFKEAWVMQLMYNHKEAPKTIEYYQKVLDVLRKMRKNTPTDKEEYFDLIEKEIEVRVKIALLKETPK